MRKKGNFDDDSFGEIIKLRPRGVLTIPKRLRSGLFDEDSLARIRRVGRKLVIEPIRTISYPARSYTNAEINDFFDLDEKETKNLKDSRKLLQCEAVPSCNWQSR